MRPIKDKILVKELKSSNVCKQKIGTVDFEISQDSRDYVEAEVISTGGEVKEIAVGDKVYIYPNSGKTIRDPETGQELRVITTMEIITVL
jgi:co-chaperonin GroES (HSP10)